MKKIIKSTVILFMILMLLSIPISYAISNDNGNQTFLSVNKQEISTGEILEISINLNQIQWNQVKFTLSSDWDISSIYSNDENEVEIERENQDVTLEIDKSKLNIEKIVLYYQIPKEVEVGKTFTLNGTIESLEQNDESQTETATCEIAVKIVENNNSENNNSENNSQKENNNTENRIPEGSINNQREIENGQNNGKGETVTQMKQTGGQTENTSLQAKSTNYNSGNSGTEENVTYNGSDNNYLSSMTISGYTLNKEFNKESSTYFVTVDEDTSSIEVVASSEDTSATVCVSGANNLKEGENKILISVTAENGNVRNYRIYVTKGR